MKYSLIENFVYFVDFHLKQTDNQLKISHREYLTDSRLIEKQSKIEINFETMTDSFYVFDQTQNNHFQRKRQSLISVYS